MACGRATLVILLLSSIVGATLAQNEAETIDLMEFVPDQSVPESASTQDAQDAGKEVAQAKDDATEYSKNANTPNEEAQKIEEAHDGLSDMIEADNAQIRELGRKKLLKKGSQKPKSLFPKKMKSVKGEDKKAEWLARRKQGEERRAAKKAERQEKKANFQKMQAEKKGTWNAIFQKKEPAPTQVTASAENLSNTNEEEKPEGEASNIIPPGDDAMSGSVTAVAEKENVAASEGSSSPKLIKFSNKHPKLGKKKSNKPKVGLTKKEGALKTLNRKSMKVVKGLPGWQKKEGTLTVKTPEEKKLQMQQKKEEWKAKKAEKIEKKRALQIEKKKTATTPVEIPELPVTAEGLISNASKDYPQLKLSEEYFLLKKAMKEITVNATLAQYIAVKAFIDPQDPDLGWRPEIVNALSARFLLFNDDLAAKIESAENPDVKNALFKFWLKHVCVQQMIINNALIGKTQKNEWKSLIESIQTSTVPENSILRDPNA